ncbi:MAG: J domain-containing protein [bacterium]
MSIFSRLINILRAHLSFSDDDDNFGANPDHHEYFKYTEGNKTFGKSQARHHRHNDDPVLAGYYENLEVPYGSDLKTVRQAWKQLVKKYHPDVHSQDAEKRQIANELTQGLNHAYEELEKQLKK